MYDIVFLLYIRGKCQNTNIVVANKKENCESPHISSGEKITQYSNIYIENNQKQIGQGFCHFDITQLNALV